MGRRLRYATGLEKWRDGFLREMSVRFGADFAADVAEALERDVEAFDERGEHG